MFGCLAWLTATGFGGFGVFCLGATGVRPGCEEGVAATGVTSGGLLMAALG